MKRVLPLLVILTFCAPAAFAAEIFVDQKNASAADKNTGTEQSPLKTIQAAVDKAQAGDTIYLKAGLYEEPVHISKSGEYNAPITLSAWKDDRVKIGFQPCASADGGQVDAA